MNDSIASRIRRIITGTAHSIVTTIEGLAPENILGQAIDEVDHAIDEVRAELGKVVAQKHHVTKTMTRLNQEHASLEAQLETALAGERDDLVETALGRQVDIEDQLPALEDQLGALAQQEKGFNQAITGLIAKRNEMEDELYRYKESVRLEGLTEAGEPAPGVGPTGDAFARADRADRSFNRLLGEVTGVRRDTLRRKQGEAGKLVELAHLNRRTRVEAKLKTLRDNLT
jgi:phage shock protein A